LPIGQRKFDDPEAVLGDAMRVNLRRRLLVHGNNAPGLAAEELYHGVGGQN
jgi:hypothetical protein